LNEVGRIKVVIVDDHRIVRKGLKSYLETTDDIEVLSELETGEAVLAYCEHVQPDVIVMDIVMPGLDGLSVTRTLCEKYPAIRVVIISGYQNNLLIRAALEAGAISFLSKDASASDVVHAIRAAQAGLPTLASDTLSLFLDQKMADGAQDTNVQANTLLRALHLTLSPLDTQEAPAPNVSAAPISTKVAVYDAPDPLSTQTQEAVAVPEKHPSAEPEMDHYYALTHRERQIITLVLLGYTSAEIGYHFDRSPRTIQKHRANLMSKLDVHNQFELTRRAYQLGIMPSDEEKERIAIAVKSPQNSKKPSQRALSGI
jgi:NarL family two-component system response regulator LiaR